MEEFRNIKGYEGIYQVSNLGRVKSLKCGKERILKAADNGHGYGIVTFLKDGERKMRTVHQLVAEYFLGHTPCGFKLVVNHIDFDKTNNKVSNLEIITNRQNTDLKHIKRSSKFVGVIWKKAAKKWMAYIEISGKQKHLGYFKCELSASNAYQTALKEIKI